MSAPQVVMIALWVIGLTVNIVKHGEEKSESERTYNCIRYTVLIALNFALLKWGGFF